MNDTDPRRPLVELLPTFLLKRRRGWTGLEDLLIESGLQRPQFFLLRAIVQETDQGVALSEDELGAKLYNPFATIHPWRSELPLLVERGYLADTDGRYTATAQGRNLIEHAEREVHGYLATIAPLPETDLRRLADRFAEIAERSIAADQPDDRPHLARAFRLPIQADSAPLVRLDWLVFVLWATRDDAHNAAWRTHGFDGPTLDLLTRLWAGEAHTLDDLTAALVASQTTRDVKRGVARLIKDGYVERNGAAIRLTTRGRRIRNAIEAETDRLYFLPWPPLSDAEISWMINTLRRLIDKLP
jgi:DNA-binding MarR family transcriptional regulator